MTMPSCIHDTALTIRTTTLRHRNTRALDGRCPRGGFQARRPLSPGTAGLPYFHEMEFSL